MEFGFLNEEKIYETRYFFIKPLSDIQTRIEDIKNNFYIERGWIYPPYEKENGGLTKPSIWYDVCSSHSIEVKGDRKDFCEDLITFAVLFFGFLKGTYLLPSNHGRFYRTPIEKEKLTGFFVRDKDIEKIMDMAAEFYLSNYKNGISKRYQAAIFWFLFGQSYNHIFERFDAQYRVLDGVFSISKELFKITENQKNIVHAKRIQYLCEYFCIPIPDWGICDENKESILSRLRNALIHEALFDGEPIGYKIPQENYSLEFPRLNEKLLLSIIGIASPVFNKMLGRNRYLISLNE